MWHGSCFLVLSMTPIFRLENLFVMILSSATGLSLLSADQSVDAMKMISFDSHTHLKIPIELDVTYKVEELSASAGLKITLLGGAHTNLGKVGVSANSTNGAGGNDSILSFQDMRTRSVKKKVLGDDVIFEIAFSSEAIKSGIESFDYRNKSSSEILIDYWFKKAPLFKGSTQSRVQNGSRKIAGIKGEGKGTVQSENSPVSKVKGGRTGSDIKKQEVPPIFEISQAIEAQSLERCFRKLSFSKDGFVKWNIFHQTFNYEKFLGLPTPDAKYKYSEPKPDSKKDEKASDKAHYLLALKLLREKKLGLALRTIDFFDQKFKTSPYANEIHFMKGNILLKLAEDLHSDRFKDQAHGIFLSLMLKEPSQERGQLSRLYLLQDRIKKKDAVQALESALAGAALKDKYQALYELAAAENQQTIGEFGRAKEMYLRVWQKKNDKENKELAIEAAFRAGECSIQEKNFEEAELLFTKAIKDFPTEINRFPSAVFNHAETYFREEKFKDSREMYQEFLNRFSLSHVAWAAALRIAEITQIIGDVKGINPQQKSDYIKGLYESVVNRYPYTPGMYLAELRLSECADLKNSKKERNLFESFFEKKNLEKQAHFLIPPLELKRWSDLAEIRFSSRTEDYNRVLPFADEYRNHFRDFQLGDGLKNEISYAVLKRGEQLVEEASTRGDFEEVLSLDLKYGDYVPSPKPISYLISLARAYQGTENFRGTLKELSQIEMRLSEASTEEKDEFYIISAEQSEKTSTKPDASISFLEKVSEDESSKAYKYFNLARLNSRKKDYKKAIEFDEKFLELAKSDSELTTQAVEAEERRIENYSLQKDYKSAVKMADRALLTMGAMTQYESNFSAIREIRALALYEMKDYARALDSFGEILKLNSEHPKRSEYEFIMARCLDGLNRGQEAVESFRKIASADKGVWGKSAKTELEQREFKASKEKSSKESK